MPVDESYEGDHSLLRSRRAQQRVGFRHFALRRARASVRCLNQLAGFQDETSWPVFPKNRAQEASIRHIVQSHMQRPRPVERMSEQEALRQLLAKRAGYGDSPGSLASLVVDRLSLPRGQHKPVSLEEVLPPREADFLKDFERKMLLSPEERAAVLERGLEGECFLDPVLQHDAKQYHRFIAELHSCNLLHFTCSPKVQIGAFAVTKKNSKQRLIIDARRTNRLFRTPPSTLLGSVDTWTRLEVPKNADVFVAQEDVKDYFYRLGIPLALGEYFSLPAIVPEMLQDAMGHMPPEVADLLDTHEAPVYPCMAVLPMGFSWAFHLAHQAHTHLASRALPEVKLLRDRTAAPRLRSTGGDGPTAMLIYADNNNHVGIDRDAVQSDQDAVMGVLHACGLDTHDVEAPSSLAESLGVRIDGLNGVVGPTPKRDWRLDRALGACNGHVKLSGKELQVIVGHVTVRALLHRGLMGFMRHCYAFIEQNYEVRTALWGSVRHELHMFRHLMVLGTGSFKQEWCPTMYCTDACLSGYAVMSSSQGIETVREIGRQDERWRFRLGDGHVAAPRRQALDTVGVFSDPLTVLPEVDGEIPRPIELTPSFPDVLPQVMEPERWQRVWCTSVRYKEPVHMIEARSIFGAVKHIVRDHRCHGLRFLILNDNMGVVLAIQKGRCCDYGLLRVIRRINAHLLATGTKLHVRWVPSEWNVADRDSRRWEVGQKSASQKELFGHSDFRVTSQSHVSSCSSEEEGGRAHEGRGEKGKQQVDRGWPQRKARAGQGGGQAFACARDSATSQHQPEGPSCIPEEEKGQGSAEEAEVRDEVESHPGRARAAGDELRQRAPAPGVLAEVGRLLHLHRPVRAANRERNPPRRSLVRLRRPPLFGRVREQLWREADGGGRVQQAGVCQVWDSAPAEVPAVHKRMASSGAYTGEDAHVGVPEVRGQWAYDRHEEERDGLVQRNHLLDIRASGRDDEGGGHRRGDGDPRAGAHRHCFGANGTRRSFKNRSVRRGLDLGRWAGAVSPELATPVGGAKDARGWRRGAALEFQCEGVPQRLEEMCGCARDREPGGEPLPKSPWGGESGSPSKAPLHPRDQATRALGQRFKCEDLRQAGQAPADLSAVRGPLPGVWRGHKVAFRRVVPQWQSLHPSECEAPSMLSLFGGIGECARAFTEQGGTSALVDRADSPENDLSKYSAMNDVLVHVHEFDMVGIDFPCNTWTRARRGKPGSGMPEPLRGAQMPELFGFAHIKGWDRIKVLEANRMLHGIYRIIRRCLTLNIPGYLENPMTSLIWRTPQIQKLLRRRHVHLIRADLCQYGVQWRKATSLLVWNCAPFQLQTCSGRGRCSRTHRPHLQLTGLSNKIFLTKQAQVYPRPFAQELVSKIIANQISLKLPPSQP